MMNDTIGAARDVTKTITDRADTFQSPILGALGVFSGDNPVFYRQSLRKHTVDTEFDVSSRGLSRSSTITPEVTMINAAVASGAKGLVHAGVGDGVLPNRNTAAKKRPQKRCGYCQELQCRHRPRRCGQQCHCRHWSS